MTKKRHTNIPAAYLVLFRENEVLLLRRCNTGYEDGNYSMIAGHVDPGETFGECIIREAKEEAGIDIDPNDIEMVHVMHRNNGEDANNERVDMFFQAKTWNGKIVNKEPHKCDDLSWFQIDDLPENVIPYIAYVIQCIKNKIYYSEYGWESET